MQMLHVYTDKYSHISQNSRCFIFFKSKQKKLIMFSDRKRVNTKVCKYKSSVIKITFTLFFQNCMVNYFYSCIQENHFRSNINSSQSQNFLCCPSIYYKMVYFILAFFINRAMPWFETVYSWIHPINWELG